MKIVVNAAVFQTFTLLSEGYGLVLFPLMFIPFLKKTLARVRGLLFKVQIL
jgi:hypothetical protein